MTSGDVVLRWQAFLRRFDLEHTFRMSKQTLGPPAPALPSPCTETLNVASGEG